MSKYLSETPVWHQSTAEILAMDEKPITILNGGSETPAFIRIERANPAGSNAGKVAIVAWQEHHAGPDDEQWETVASLSFPSAHSAKFCESRPWSVYLNQDALRLARPHNTEVPNLAGFLLRLPTV